MPERLTQCKARPLRDRRYEAGPSSRTTRLRRLRRMRLLERFGLGGIFAQDEVLQLRRARPAHRALRLCAAPAPHRPGSPHRRACPPDGHDKRRILRAVDRRAHLLLRAVLRFCACRRVGSMPGAGGSTRSRWGRLSRVGSTPPHRSQRRYRTGLLPRVRASNRCSGQGCEIGVRGSQRASSRRIRAHGSRRHWLRRRSARCQ